MSWHDLDLTFDLAVVAWTFRMCKKLILGRDIGQGV